MYEARFVRQKLQQATFLALSVPTTGPSTSASTRTTNKEATGTSPSPSLSLFLSCMHVYINFLEI